MNYRQNSENTPYFINWIKPSLNCQLMEVENVNGLGPWWTHTQSWLDFQGCFVNFTAYENQFGLKGVMYASKYENQGYFYMDLTGPKFDCQWARRADDPS